MIFMILSNYNNILSFDRIISQIHFAIIDSGDLLRFIMKPDEGDPVGTTIM